MPAGFARTRSRRRSDPGARGPHECPRRCRRRRKIGSPHARRASACCRALARMPQTARARVASSTGNRANKVRPPSVARRPSTHREWAGSGRLVGGPFMPRSRTRVVPPRGGYFAGVDSSAGSGTNTAAPPTHAATAPEAAGLSMMSWHWAGVLFTTWPEAMPFASFASPRA